MMNLEKKDEDEYYLPFQGLEKGIVLQDSRLFNETPLNPRKCCHLLTKLLYLFAQGEEFTTTEATEVFFAVTKLFQSQDVALRRMVYLVLKELLGIAEDAIIVISCLTKDMNSSIDLYRANAIRVLTKIPDISMFGAAAERYLKQAIVDKEAYVASAALVSGVHLMNTSSVGADIVKRWYSEIQTATKSKSSTMVQYHALGLLHQIKRHDRLAVSKLVHNMTRSPIRSSYAHCLLVRFTCKVMSEEEDPSERARLYDYLESCLRHKSEIVIYEAARGICDLRDVTSKELSPAISVLQLFLSSPKATLRFSAVRTLNKVAMTHPLAVTSCNIDMENLIGDNNRSIATFAITTLLKTGSESSVDRLMKQISKFMNEISDEFKIVVVDAIKTLCIKYKQKHHSLMKFLSNMLRDEGGYEYKKAIVETTLFILSQIPESKEAGLTYLCEFIEDCEFTQLSIKILHLLGEEGPSTSNPSKFIRYIYNRVILEEANVRASAVTALAQFGVTSDSLRPRIIVLLKRCLHDSEDEVRDRATFYLRMLEKDLDMVKELSKEFHIPLENLEKSLTEYQESESYHIPFDISSVSTEVVMTPAARAAKTGVSGMIVSTSEPKSSSYDEALEEIPEFAHVGKRFRSTKVTELTEAKTEYVVNCVKHIFPGHIIFQFNCTNTLEDQLLENVMVRMESTCTDFNLVSEIPIEQLPFQVPGVAYVCLAYEPGTTPTGTFVNTLKFTVKDVDPATGEVDDFGIEDEYQLEDSEVTVADYMKKVVMANFADHWEKLADENEVVEVFSLTSMKTIRDAVSAIIEYLGMQPCDRSDTVSAKKTKHILYLYGVFIRGVHVFVRVRMRAHPTNGVNIELTVRSKDRGVNAVLATAF